MCYFFAEHLAITMDVSIFCQNNIYFSDNKSRLTELEYLYTCHVTAALSNCQHSTCHTFSVRISRCKINTDLTTNVSICQEGGERAAERNACLHILLSSSLADFLFGFYQRPQTLNSGSNERRTDTVFTSQLRLFLLCLSLKKKKRPQKQ